MTKEIATIPDYLKASDRDVRALGMRPDELKLSNLIIVQGSRSKAKEVMPDVRDGDIVDIDRKINYGRSVTVSILARNISWYKEVKEGDDGKKLATSLKFHSKDGVYWNDGTGLTDYDKYYHIRYRLLVIVDGESMPVTFTLKGASKKAGLKLLNAVNNHIVEGASIYGVQYILKTGMVEFGPNHSPWAISDFDRKEGFISEDASKSYSKFNDIIDNGGYQKQLTEASEATEDASELGLD